MKAVKRSLLKIIILRRIQAYRCGYRNLHPLSEAAKFRHNDCHAGIEFMHHVVLIHAQDWFLSRLFNSNLETFEPFYANWR
jgi:hypothetical protein